MPRNRKGHGTLKSLIWNPTPDSSPLPKPVAEFARFVNEQARHYTEQFSDNEKKFIPFPVLREYWTRARIHQVQRCCSPPFSLNIDSIREKYLRTFSTLVYCNYVTSIGEFTSYNLNDDRLPLESRPEQWPRAPGHDHLFDAVSEHQWLFFPLIFTDLEDRCLNARYVLPILAVSNIPHGRDEVIIRKITIHDSCNLLLPQGQKDRPSQNTFALKTYYRSRFQRTYENEIRVLRQLKNSSPRNVITYYGSFRHNDSYNIILEYADGGDLAEYLNKKRCPKGAEIKTFWESLSQCFDGLNDVHHLKNIDGSYVHGIHEDIAPENILLFKGPSHSHYDFVPKIADFGMFTPVESRVNSNDARGNDRGGNQLYSAPERSQRDGHNTINTINNKADMFAFGAVLSDTCAWVKGGPTEKAKYLQQRKNYHQNVETQCGRDYEGCFHDGVERLPIVDDMHEVIRNHCQLANDKITPRVIEMIEQYMLLPNPNSRYGAGELSKRFNEILRPNSDTTLVADPQPVRESRDQSLADLGKRIAKRESASGPEAKRFRNSVDADIERLSKDLNINVPHRHHLFYIDDSTSMSKHAKSVEEAFLALLHLTRRLEGHKVELCFASDSKKIHQKRRAKGLAQLVARQEYLRQPDMMEQCFVQLVHNVIIPRLPSHIFGMKVNLFAKTKKPTSIYVFTDGNWGRQGGPADGACGVEGPIQQLSRELLKRNLDKNYVSFHFVRFGDDPDGRRHLTYLDRVGWGTNRDNVDVKSVTSPVRSVVIGPISQVNDASEEDEDDW